MADGPRRRGIRRDRDGRSGADLLLEPGPDPAELGVPLDTRSSTRRSRRTAISLTATALEKSVGQTWSDPAVGQIAGPRPVRGAARLGFLPYSVQQQANRGGVVAGTTFYIVDAKTGAVLASQDVGSDGVNETNNNCATDNGVAGCQKIKNALQVGSGGDRAADSRYITKAYIGDLDGKIWRFDIGLTGGVADHQRDRRSCTRRAPTIRSSPRWRPSTVGTTAVHVHRHRQRPAAVDRQEHDLRAARRPRQRRDRHRRRSRSCSRRPQRHRRSRRRESHGVPGGRRRHRVLHDDDSQAAPCTAPDAQPLRVHVHRRRRRTTPPATTSARTSQDTPLVRTIAGAARDRAVHRRSAPGVRRRRTKSRCSATRTTSTTASARRACASCRGARCGRLEDFVTCAACGARIRADRERCLRCEQILVAAPGAAARPAADAGAAAAAAGAAVVAVLLVGRARVAQPSGRR